jgi:NAD(P)-dependent dehydrogenase (short-subunit alcohol dehydrogenase family)
MMNRRVSEMTALGRAGVPDDIGPMIAFLVSDDDRWIKAQRTAGSSFGTPFLDERGKVIRWYATGTDIDDRKRAEDRIRNETVALREDIVRSST